MQQRMTRALARVSEIDSLVRHWPRGARAAVEALVRRYGLPHEATSHQFVWYFCGPWKRTVVHRDGALHRFPAAHRDYLAQTIDYRVPVEACERLAAFDGSVLVDRTRGELTAYCANEEANYLLMNLANDVIMGKRTVDEARARCAGVWAARRVGWPMPAAAGLTFTTGLTTAEAVTETSDPDHSLVTLPGWRFR